MINKITDQDLENVLSRLINHSSNLEGNTIPEETVESILNNSIPSNYEGNTIEINKIKNHKKSFDIMINILKDNKTLDIFFMKDINKNLINKLNKNDLKVNTIFLKKWSENLISKLNLCRTKEEKFKLILKNYLQFEKDKPFSHGNGRTGRMLINYYLLENNLPPITFKKINNKEYLNIIRTQNIEKLLQYTKPLLEKEKEHLKKINKKLVEKNNEFER